MSIAVFPLKLWYPLQHEITYANYSVDFGDGFGQFANKNLSWGPRSDGEGNQATYKGINRFTIQIHNMQHVNEVTATHNANVLWNFYKARLGSFDAFYFYNPGEQDTIDLTGADVLGRYLVRFEEDKLTREMFRLKLYNAGISIREWRA